MSHGSILYVQYPIINHVVPRMMPAAAVIISNLPVKQVRMESRETETKEK